MKRVIIILFTLAAICSCCREGKLVSLARQSLPDFLDMEMRDYMGTAEKPTIKDLAVVYDCDSLCVLQCRAAAKDDYGEIQSETVRYIFIKDTFVSRMSGKDTYYHFVQGAVYLDNDGIKNFCDKMRRDSHKQYVKYLSRCKPVDMFR